jgi:phage gpG-like protein
MSVRLVFKIARDTATPRVEAIAAHASDTRPLKAAIGQAFVAGTKRRFRSGGEPAGSWPKSRRAREQGGQTLVDTGHLRRSVSFRVEGDRVVVGSNVRQAAIHQFGGVIRPKAGKALAIPMSGVKGRPGDFSDTFIRATKDEGGAGAKAMAIIWQQGDPPKALFVLVKSVTIPARPFGGYGDYEARTVRRLVRKYLGGGDLPPPSVGAA